MVGHVFGFGSLVDLPALAAFLGRPPFAPGEAVLCTLPGHRRVWNIAWDNRHDRPDRTYYLDTDTGRRAEVFITVVNVVQDSDYRVNGVLFPVTEVQLRRLDQREQNYDRVPISDLDGAEPAGPLWVYKGKSAAEARFRDGLAGGLAVINHDYHDRVLTAFQSHGPEFLARYHSSTEAPKVPLRRLKQVAPA